MNWKDQKIQVGYLLIRRMHQKVLLFVWDIIAVRLRWILQQHLILIMIIVRLERYLRLELLKS